jgi:vesicular inhibitory amino acid transporter
MCAVVDDVYIPQVFNTTNMLMGVGILSLPFALRVAGWLGLVGLLGLSAVTNYTGRLLGRCMSRTHARAYPDIAYIAFGPRWKAVVGVVLYTELFMMTALFLVLMGTNLAHVFPRLSAKWCMAIAFLLLLPVLNLSDLRVLSYFSAVGTASTLVLVLVIIAYAGGQLSEAVHDRAMPADTVFIATDTFGFAFGLFACAYSGHAVFPSVYEAMQVLQLCVSFTHTLTCIRPVPGKVPVPSCYVFHVYRGGRMLYIGCMRRISGVRIRNI